MGMPQELPEQSRYERETDHHIFSSSPHDGQRSEVPIACESVDTFEKAPIVPSEAFEQLEKDEAVQEQADDGLLCIADDQVVDPGHGHDCAAGVAYDGDHKEWAAGKVEIVKDYYTFDANTGEAWFPLALLHSEVHAADDGPSWEFLPSVGTWLTLQPLRHRDDGRVDLTVGERGPKKIDELFYAVAHRKYVQVLDLVSADERLREEWIAASAFQKFQLEREHEQSKGALRPQTARRVKTWESLCRFIETGDRARVSVMQKVFAQILEL